jgi:hypothetical protein
MRGMIDPARDVYMVPVRLLDNKTGLVIRDTPGDAEVGIQVHGEDAIRWIKRASIAELEGLFFEVRWPGIMGEAVELGDVIEADIGGPFGGVWLKKRAE